MISFETALLFIGIVLPLCFVPSPELIMVISQSSAQGRMAGVAITLGLCTAALLFKRLASFFGTNGFIITHKCAKIC